MCARRGYAITENVRYYIKLSAQGEDMDQHRIELSATSYRIVCARRGYAIIEHIRHHITLYLQGEDM